MISSIEGDLFTCGVPAIAHGVNCSGVMGAGIAVQFRDRWPVMYETYQIRCREGRMVPGDVMTWPVRGMDVFNLATQDQPGADAHPWMIAAAVGRMIQMIVTGSYAPGRKVAMPEIGCGIGGLSRADLDLALSPYEHAPVDLVVVRYKP